jgi:ElaB/YqjD/DUF883 family membrane-anchored ribosome-binding protein
MARHRASSASIAGDTAAAGAAALREAKASLDDTIALVGEKGEEALDSLREVGDTLVEGIEDALQRRPIVTVGIAIGIGFLLGTAWRR